MTLRLNDIFATLDRWKAAGTNVVGWRMTADDLEALWAEIEADRIADGRPRPKPELSPGVTYEICGRPVTLVPNGPAYALIPGQHLLQPMRVELVHA